MNGEPEKPSSNITGEGSKESTEPKQQKVRESAEGLDKSGSIDERKTEQSSTESKSQSLKMAASSYGEAVSPSKRGFKTSAKLKKAKPPRKKRVESKSQSAEEIADLGTARTETPKPRTSSSSRSLGKKIPSLCTPSASSLRVKSESLRTPSVGANTACSSASRMPMKPEKEPHERVVCRKCEKCNRTITPSSLNMSGNAPQDSPLALTSAGPSDITSAPVDPRLLSPRGSEANLRKNIPIRRPAKSETKTAMEPNQSYPICRCALDPHSSRQFPTSSQRIDIHFDAKFQIRDVDTNLEHTLLINGYFLDKNLMRLTLNGKFCRI
ncbi:hypothetical protein ANCCAN_10302 [Ancylostoma caninum]|uniref:Uncharacterized protein n=1 Tax=Ancylostoma caninum TaxID=29170 RepID=A0A368GLG4_ANCCA|nr:hypothetical protein ANCCAN_10302 [Ancylostoma caninum]